MSTGVPWSVKGIDRKARETAKDLARRSGMTLGEWLNQVIEYQGEGKITPLPHTNNLTEAVERLTARIEAAETRSTLAVTGIDQSVRGLAARLEAAERERDAAAAEVVDRLGRLEDGAGPRSTEALRALEGSFNQIAGQVHDNETAQKQILAEIRNELGALAGRLGALDAGGADAVLGDAERRLEALAASVSSKVEEVRRQIEAQAPRDADTRLANVEGALLRVQNQVREAERRSTGAIERMGHDVLRVADTLSRQVKGVEARAADAIDRLGGDVARLTEQLDVRLCEADNAQAKALERLGDEIARIAERLSDRIGASERRTAQTLDQAAGPAAETRFDDSSALTARIRLSEDRTARLLEEGRARIEERLAGRPLLGVDEADVPAAIDPEDFSPAAFAPREPARSFASANEAPAPVLYPDARSEDAVDYAFAPPSFDPVEPDADDQPSFAPVGDLADPFVEASADPFASVELEPREIAEDPFADLQAAMAASDRDDGEETFDDPFAAELEPAAPFESASFDAVDPFEAVAEPGASDEQFEAAEGGKFTPGPFAPAEDPAEDLLEPEARSVAFESEEQDEFVGAAAAPEAPVSRMEFIERARAAARAAHEGNERGSIRGFGLGVRRAGGRPKSGLLMSTAVLVCLGSGLVGATILGPKLKQDAEPNAEGGKPAAMQPRAAMLTAPQPIDSESKAPPSAATAPINPGAASSTPATSGAATAIGRDDPAMLYAEAVRLIDAKDKAAVEPLRHAANLGHPQAQLQLGRLYETGQLGVVRDLAEARRWTQRAADAGLSKAMHNLAMYYFNGEGGERSPAIAAQWFRQASEHGLVDSQYNLGLLYERGIGVTQNPAEAYKWFLVASRSGEAQPRAEARSAALRVRPLLSGEAQLAAERAAASQANQPTQQAAVGAPR